MPQISELLQAVKRVDRYPDKINVSFDHPLSQQDYHRIKQGHRGKIHPNRDPFWWLSITQPTPQVLKKIKAARPNHHRVSFLEPALDLIFDNEDYKWQWYAFVLCHSVKPYQRGTGWLYWESGDGKDKIKRLPVPDVLMTDVEWLETLRKPFTFYSAGVKTINNDVMYASKISRLPTHDPECLHIERRERSKALRRIDIGNIDDVLEMNHDDFWTDNLHLYTIDPVRFGRLYFNWQNGTRHKQPCIERSGCIEYQRDQRIGNQIIRYYRSVPEIIRIYQPHFNVKSCLVPIDIEPLLRAPTHYSNKGGQVMKVMSGVQFVELNANDRGTSP
jgi:hypothetical protein